MGGFGAFDIARQEPFSLIGASGAVLRRRRPLARRLWNRRSANRRPGAFDDDADFEANDVIALVGPPGSPLSGKRFWLDVGDEDPFTEANGTLAQQLQRGGAQGRLFEGKGAHESDYWRSNWRRYMHFYARALKKCQQSENEGGDRDRAGAANESKGKQAADKQGG